MEGHDLYLQFGVKELIYAFASIMSFGLVGLWGLLRMTVYSPLNQIVDEMRSLQTTVARHDNRVTLMEFRLEKIERKEEG